MLPRQVIRSVHAFCAMGLALLAPGCRTDPVRVWHDADGGSDSRRTLPGATAPAAGGSPLTAGSPCESPGECRTGFCADGVCCNVACTGVCVACDLPGQSGTCTPVAAGGEDRHGLCRKDPLESCGQSGYCNGQGGCAKYSIGTVCRRSSCPDREHFVPPSLCDGDGNCVHGTVLGCSPSTCQDGLCLASCTSDDACVPPQTCVAGSCGPKGLGLDCAAGAQCASGFCVDGVCCDAACTGRCRFCASPETRGRCTPVRAGLPDPRAARGETDPEKICVVQGAAGCGQNGLCNGTAGCQLYRDGTVCREPRCDTAGNTGTAAGTCAGGACRVPGAASCAPFQGCSGVSCRSSCQNDDECAAGFVCVSGACAKRSNGAVCTRALECASGICAQGRCCGSVCQASCKSCALTGQEGTCVNVPSGGADPSGGCLDDVCSNACNGAGGCRREAAGTACGANSCGPGNSILTRVCNGVGVCEARPVAGAPCGACGGTTLCDGSCSRPTPPNHDQPCGKCGGKVTCAGSCSVVDPPNVGGSCGSAGTVDCNGGCRGPLFRLFHGGVGDHFYTMSAGERGTAINVHGYKDEGTACHIYETSVPGTVPLHRLYSAATGDHFYTTSADERDRAVSAFGYVNEGTTGFVYTNQAPGTVPLYRLLSGAAGDHFYTVSASERDLAVSASGYVFEGVACFVFLP